jgi:hypothetical protein
MHTSTIRPGLLVAIKTSVTGNVQYSKVDIDRSREDKTDRATWQTQRTIADVEEHDRACKVRSEVNHALRRLCANTAFGNLCPEDRADELSQAIVDARAKVDAFNAEATITRVTIHVIAGRVAADDVEAARAIRSELAEVIGEMERGIANLQPEKIREAAVKAKELSEMLTDEAKFKVDLAITAGRSAATAINRAVKAGEEAAKVVDKAVLTQLNGARLAFLDVEEPAAPPTPAVRRPKARARAIDLEA